MVGGANNPRQKQSEKERTAQLLVEHHNLQPAVHSYSYIAGGDCFFDCMEYLTGVPSLAIRELVILTLRRAMSECVSTAINMAIQVASNRLGLGRSMTPQEYMAILTRSAEEGGMWAGRTVSGLSAGHISNDLDSNSPERHN